jgi:hypothetical protein
VLPICGESPSGAQSPGDNKDPGNDKSSSDDRSSGNTERVKIDANNLHIEADRVTFKNPIAHASGNIRLTGKNFYVRCEELEYNVQSKDVDANGIAMGIDRAYVSAKRANFSGNQIAIEEACVGVNLGFVGMAPNLKTKKIIYNYAKNRGMAQQTWFHLGKIPLMGLPYISVSDWVRFVDMHFGAGHTSKLGGYFQSEILYNIYEDLYFGLLLDGYAKRGFLLGPVLKVDCEGEAITSHLKLRMGYIADHGERGEDVDKTPIGKKRWFIDGKQNHHFGQSVDILSDFLWVSDGRMADDFRLDLVEDSDIRDSFGEFDYRGEGDLLTVFTRVKMNRHQDFSQQIPSIRFERFPREIFDTGLYYFGYIDFTRQKPGRESLAIAEQWEAGAVDRIDSYWGINWPMEPGDGIKFTPLVGGKWTRYGGTGDRFLGELGFDFYANFYAIYSQPVCWLGAKEWKHVLRPVVKYRHVSSAGKRVEKPIDWRRNNDFLPCIDLAEMRNIDDLQRRSVLRLGLENNFFAKNEKNKIRQIASLDFYQDLRLKRRYDVIDGQRQREEYRSDFYVFSELNFRRWLNLCLYSRLDGKHFSLREMNAEINFISGDLWELGFRVKFVKHRIDQFGINCRFRLNEVSQIDFETKINGKNGKFLAAEIGYLTRWCNIWDVKFFCKIKNHSGRDSRFQPGFSINLMSW